MLVIVREEYNYNLSGPWQRRYEQNERVQAKRGSIPTRVSLLCPWKKFFTTLSSP